MRHAGGVLLGEGGGKHHSNKEVALGRKMAEYMLRMSDRLQQTESEVGSSELLALFPEWRMKVLCHL